VVFACAVAAEQRDNLALPHFQPDAVQDVALAVIGVEALGLEDDGAHAATFPKYAACTASLAAISGGVPSARNLPWSSTMMRSARWKTTRISCSISTIVSFCSRCQLTDQLGDVVGFLVAHAGGRLVEQQEPRLERQRHHDLGGALVAMGQLADQPVGLFGQAAHFQQINDARLDLAVSILRLPKPQPIAAGDLDRDAQIFPDGELRKYLGDLEGPRDTAPHPPCRQEMRHVVAVENDTAAARREEPADQVERTWSCRRPLGPITARSSPGSTIIDTSLTATRLPKCFETFSTRNRVTMSPFAE